MDFDITERSLPLNVDPTGAVQLDDPTSTARSSALTEASLSSSQPSSPTGARKRTIDEAYLRSEPPAASTTPQKTPPRQSLTDRFSRRSASKGHSQFEQTGSSNLRTAISAPQSSPMVLMASSGPTSGQQQSNQNVQIDTFSEQIANFQQEIETEYNQFEKSLESRSCSTELDALDWDALQDRYMKDMEPLITEESAIKNNCSIRLQQLLLWMQVSSDKEAERAIKRLRTRVALVQNSEARLAKRQAHYDEVLTAFQNAMKLLAIT